MPHGYSGSEDGRGQEFLYRHDWGEQMKGKHQVRILAVNLVVSGIFVSEKRFSIPYLS